MAFKRSGVQSPSSPLNTLRAAFAFTAGFAFNTGLALAAAALGFDEDFGDFLGDAFGVALVDRVGTGFRLFALADFIGAAPPGGTALLPLDTPVI